MRMFRSARMQVSRTMLSCFFMCSVGVMGLGLYACGADDSTLLPTGNNPGGTPATGGSGGAAGSEPGEGGFEPFAGPCAGHANEQICIDGNAVICDENEDVASEQECGDDICVPGGVGCILCIAGQFHCEGNAVQQCNVGPPPSWETIATCNPLSLERCSSTKGVCVTLEVTGGTAPTGTYYRFAWFTSADGFLGGYDVDSLDDKLYVNNGGTSLDVYQVTLLDSDGDGELEPNQHPDNPDLTGPIEQRTLTFLQSYSVTLANPSRGELYITQDSAYFVDRHNGPAGDIYLYPLGGAKSTFLSSNSAIEMSFIGFNEETRVWYAGSEAGRRVYSFHEPSGEWVAEFLYPDLTGGHMDGIEVVADPDTGTTYMYVSDMTSDFLGQYRRDRDDTWVQENLFEYYEPNGAALEGMGFGALNHFWATGGGAIYEIGGGDLAEYVEPEPPPR